MRSCKRATSEKPKKKKHIITKTTSKARDEPDEEGRRNTTRSKTIASGLSVCVTLVCHLSLSLVLLSRRFTHHANCAHTHTHTHTQANPARTHLHTHALNQCEFCADGPSTSPMMIMMMIPTHSKQHRQQPVHQRKHIFLDCCQTMQTSKRRRYQWRQYETK